MIKTNDQAVLAPHHPLAALRPLSGQHSRLLSGLHQLLQLRHCSVDEGLHDGGQLCVQAGGEAHPAG